MSCEGGIAQLDAPFPNCNNPLGRGGWRPTGAKAGA